MSLGYHTHPFKNNRFSKQIKKDMHITLGLNIKKLLTYRKSNFKKLCKTKADSCLYWKTSWTGTLNTLQQCHEEEDDDDDMCRCPNPPPLMQTGHMMSRYALPYLSNQKSM